VNERDNCTPVTDVAVNTTAPVREVAPVLTWVVNTTDPFPVPLDELNDTQSGPVTTQLLFEVTVRVLVTTPAVGFHAVVGEMVKVGGGGAACVTVNERDTCAPIVLVVVNTTGPLRAEAVVLASVVNTTEPFPEPPDGLTVTQLGAVTTQLLFEVTVRVLDTTPAVGFHAVVGAMVKVGGGGAA